MRSPTFKPWMLLPVVAAAFLSPAAQAQDTFRVYAGLAPTTYSIAFDNKSPTAYTSKTAKAKPKSAVSPKAKSEDPPPPSDSSKSTTAPGNTPSPKSDGF